MIKYLKTSETAAVAAQWSDKAGRNPALPVPHPYRPQERIKPRPGEIRRCRFRIRIGRRSG